MIICSFAQITRIRVNEANMFIERDISKTNLDILNIEFYNYFVKYNFKKGTDTYV